MKAMDLMTGLNGVRDSFIMEAEEFRLGKRKPRRVPVKKLWLIAAIIALTLLLVGCAVAYILRMQNLKVGEYRFYIPTEYDENGEVIPVESQEPITLLSVQRTNMEALAEWIAFTNTYDQDLTIAGEADKAAKSGKLWDIPENYRMTYGCYSQEMVDRLNQIAEKYQLKLLSSFIPLNYYENSVLFRCLGINGLVYDKPNVQVKYWDGDFHLEGTFDLNMVVTGNFEGWKWEESSVYYRYSLKGYFDPATDTMLESRNYTQWDYTRKDGKRVLLVLGEENARIYADLPDAFVTIGLEPVILVNDSEEPMTKEALQQLAELFDLSVKPQSATMAQVEKYMADAQAAHEAELEASQAEREAMYAAGYQNFVKYRLETFHRPENLSYALYDLNGDGIQELIINGLDILSMKDGISYRYFDVSEAILPAGKVVPCEDGIFEVYSEFFEVHQYHFYQANSDTAAFLTGIIHDTKADKWYKSLDGGTENTSPISEEEAKAILAAHPQKQIQWLPLVKFGQAYAAGTYTDPYAAYIADALARYDNAETFRYALMDLNGDGVQELITAQPDSQTMTIFTIQAGERKQYADSVSYICEGGILEKVEEGMDSGKYYGFFRCGTDGPELIEKIVRDPITLYWGHVQSGKEGRTVRAEEAQAVLDSYQHINLNWKLFPEYPLR